MVPVLVLRNGVNTVVMLCVTVRKCLYTNAGSSLSVNAGREPPDGRLLALTPCLLVEKRLAAPGLRAGARRCVDGDNAVFRKWRRARDVA